MSAGYFPKREKIGLEDLFKGLVTASHILHSNNVLDAYGHISVRSPDNPATFWMPCNISPALVSSQDDLIEYNVDDATPVEKNAKPGYLERHIHSEIYKRFPGINSVVHSHCGDVLPYCISGVPLKATVHMAGFLGSSTPVWDASAHYASGSKHDLLVRDSALGASLSAAFKPATSAGFVYSKMRAALPAQLGGQSSDPAKEPDYAVVLMQSHGFTTAAHSIEEAVYQAIYTKEAAKTQTLALTIRNAHFGHVVEGKIDVEGGGKIKSAKVKAEGDIKYLSDREAHDAWEANQGTVARPWGLWCREVAVNPLYENNCPGGD
ncbi:class II aldolase and Adducin N-terminal domain-containing protein [Lophiotrema nucula]|uniref:Class II aldolase and Adducin N-terminal domain-containing protein n=1 Tax=Lophiotrema nucula TaxID=690887 RepID=A0A6A5YTH9_9PLEO|nr:class II aldolase and Adducin N-terminal domain-containing protein [Lophiotrema nucula]